MGLNQISIDARYNRGMRFRKLRIAWSVLCSIACVLLIVLSVRSYWRHDCLNNLNRNLIATTVGSNWGVIYYSQIDWNMDVGASHAASHGWRYDVLQPGAPGKWRWVDSINSPGVFYFGISHWLLILPLVILAGASWINWRFRLRTLLIATTLVAALLGFVVYMAKR